MARTMGTITNYDDDEHPYLRGHKVRIGQLEHFLWAYQGYSEREHEHGDDIMRRAIAEGVACGRQPHGVVVPPACKRCLQRDRPRASQ